MQLIPEYLVLLLFLFQKISLAFDFTLRSVMLYFIIIFINQILYVQNEAVHKPVVFIRQKAACPKECRFSSQNHFSEIVTFAGSISACRYTISKICES